MTATGRVAEDSPCELVAVTERVKVVPTSAALGVKVKVLFDRLRVPAGAGSKVHDLIPPSGSTPIATVRVLLRATDTASPGKTMVGGSLVPMAVPERVMA